MESTSKLIELKKKLTEEISKDVSDNSVIISLSNLLNDILKIVNLSINTT